MTSRLVPVGVSRTQTSNMADDRVLEEPRDFCAELRSKTKDIHDRSDRLINWKLAIVLTDLKLWGDVLADFYFVFQTIETCLEEYHSHPHVGPLYHPAILRRVAFAKDLEYYLGKDWNSFVKPSPPAAKYCDRIMEAAKTNPALLIAYVHSMYLGLVAGGQTIKRIVKRTLGISGKDGGLAIFEFNDIYKNELRHHIYNAINSMDLSESDREDIITEKILCFQMNNSIADYVKPTIQSTSRLSKCLCLLLLIVILICVGLAYMFKLFVI